MSSPSTSLLQHFDRLAEAPGGIAKLRALILQLAVQGKLVDQDLEDRSALELAVTLNKSLEYGIVLPWLIPPNWGVTTVEALAGHDGFFGDGDWVESKDQDPNGDVRLTQLADVGLGFYRDRSSRFMTHAAAERLRCTYLEVGDVLIARMPDPLGRACIFPGDKKPCVTVVDVAILRVTKKGVLPEYIVHALNSAVFSTMVLAKAAGTTRSRISRGNLAKFPFPLPPLAEQRRIVAKVEELMGLCDTLETAQRERESIRTHLRTSALHQLASPDPDSKSAAFVLQNLPRLIAAPKDLAQIRQTVLHLAVLGKLVEQSEADKSGAQLLEEIRELRAKCRHRSKKSEVDDSDPKFIQHLPSNPPGNWGVCPLEDIFRFIDYRGRTPARTASGVRLITAKNIRMGFVSNEPVEFIDEQAYDGWMTRGFPKRGDLLFVTEGATMGFVAMLDLSFKFALAQRTIAFQPYFPDSSGFYLFALMSPPIQEAVITNASGTAVKGIKAAKLKRIRVPLPPIAEQRRIVAKVDELMAVLDALEATLTTTRTTSERLLAATIARLDEPAESESPVLMSAEDPAPYGA